MMCVKTDVFFKGFRRYIAQPDGHGFRKRYSRRALFGQADSHAIEKQGVIAVIPRPERVSLFPWPGQPGKSAIGIGYPEKKLRKKPLVNTTLKSRFQFLIGFLNFLESFFRQFLEFFPHVADFVRMVGVCQFSVSFLDFIGRGVFFNPENGVGIL